MDILSKNIRKIYFKYLLSAFGSAVVVSIYSIVDIVAVGQYEGPNGSAALSCITPLWSVVMSLGIMLGIGGSVLMSFSRGDNRRKDGNRYFSLTLYMSIALSLILLTLIGTFHKDVFRFFGANDELMPYVIDYGKWIIAVIPAFLISQVLLSFIRNDESPFLCTFAIVCGGILNMIGDYLLVFVFDMGAGGAGLATAIGELVGTCILCTYFFTKKCTLKLARPKNVFKNMIRIMSNGFAPFIIDLSFGIMVILFNNQIMRYGNTTYLAVFGTVANCAILIQSLFYAVGQAIQPIISVSFGAGESKRISKVLHMAVITCIIMGITFLTLAYIFPSYIIKLFMSASDEVISIGPEIFRKYSIAFLFMGINIVAGYYLQSIMKSVYSTVISLLRGFVLCSVFVILLPAIFGFDYIWFTMPLTELITMAISTFLIIRTKK